MITDLVELLDMYNEGVWSRGDLFQRIALLVPASSVQQIVDELPDPHRTEFIAWLRETYDHEVAAQDFVVIGRQENAASRLQRIEEIRAWLRMQRAEPS